MCDQANALGPASGASPGRDASHDPDRISPITIGIENRGTAQPFQRLLTGHRFAVCAVRLPADDGDIHRAAINAEVVIRNAFGLSVDFVSQVMRATPG
jgi:hypothetical protein